MKKQFFLLFAMMLFSLAAFSQRTVSGNITSPQGDALIGATVMEAGTNNGTITDLDGNFSLNVANDAKLAVSYTGYATQEVEIGSTGVVNISLQEGALLDEVVVTALGIERDKKALAYSVTEITSENLEVAREINVANSLAGKVAGVNISPTSGGAAGSARIVIRGNSSISGNNQPLFVVDGVPINNDNQGSAGMWGGSDGGDGISSINPSDIEKMTVLKGNTAAALYGYRAANGAVIITTKKGKASNGIGVEFNTNYVATTYRNTYDFQQQYGHGQRGVAPATTEEAFANGLVAWGGQLGGSALQFDGVSRPYEYAGDNLGRFYETGSTFTNTLALTGGNENINYRLAGTALNNSDIIPNSGVDRYTFTFNSGAQLSDRLSATMTASYTDEDATNRPRLSDSPGNANYTVWSLPPTINVDDLKGSTDKLGAAEDGFELQFNDNVFVTNPWWGTHQFENNSQKKRLIGSFALTYQLTDDISIAGSLGLDQFSRRARNLTPYGTAYSNFGQLTETNLQFQELNKQLLITFDRNLTDQIGLNLVLGGNQQNTRNETLGGGGNNFSIPFLHDIRNIPTATDRYGFNELAVNSIFGQAEIALSNSLYVTGTARQDWFSTLTRPTGDSNNSKLYTSAGVSWVFTEALSGLSNTLDYGKLRASWAQVGGATSPYQLALNYGVFGSNGGAPLGGVSNGSIPNSNLVPSTSTEYEIGADLRGMGGRIGLDIAYYNRTTTDDILNAAASPTSGFGSISVNVGEIRNSGVEALLTVVPVKTNKFEWELGINYGRNSNKVVSLLTPEDDGEDIRVGESRTRNAYIHHVEGLPYSQIMGFEYARDASGNIEYDENGLPNRGEFVSFGTGVHPTNIGISNSITFGNFRVRALIDIKSGGYIYAATNAYGYFRGLHQNTLVGRTDGNVGPVTIPDAANVQDYYQRIAFNVTEEFVEKADFGKLRELIVSYRVPSSLLTNLPFASADISLSGRNLALLWSSVDNIDPESNIANGNAQGLEMFGVPSTKSIGLNLNVKF